ncbi:uncharacterized protein LOC127750830 [Frankliniella occidentalis]|uniref:Uncharacterized protein LOC127750830 n=1 Tax=Frankliniella occidentalis TaxID=133901 RepID=A0A9C6X5A5_FRAOC|nr:uncharacterized protein LOC127750830 [Frankliniella occidentalis]
MASIVPGKKFYSQAEFEEAKSKYEWEQRVPYTVINCTKRERYNGKLKPGRPEVPETFDWKDAILACKHFGGVREHEHVEGKARRPNQSSYKRDCLAKFNIIYSLDEKCYFVKTVETNHRNHELVARSDLHLHYPEFKNPDQNTLDEVSKLFDYDVKRHKIRDLLVANGIKATSQDIQNLRNKWNAKFKGTDSREDALFKQLHLLKEEDPNSIVVITHDPETFVVQSVFFQTSEMRAAHELYPEVLIMDTTYQLSENDMPLIVYEGIDCFGSGRILGYALIISEKLPIVTASLELLKLGCPDVSEKVQVVLVDKDQSELAAIKQVLPNAEVHLCDYHVKDAMKRTGFKKLAGDKCDEVKPILDKLVYAFSKVDYDAAYAKLQEVVGVESKFMKYFDKYWHNSGLIWTEYRRNLAFTLGERTTGRVECHNARIKEIIDKKIPVAMVIMRLRTINRNSSIEHDHKLFVSLVKTKYHKYTKDPVVQTIVKSNTPFVADMLKRQYERSLEPPSDNIHKVNTTQCDCAFYTKFQLTCAHIFRERRIKGLEIYDHSVIPKRWTVVMEISKDKKISNVDILIAPIKQPKKREPLFAEDRMVERILTSRLMFS